MIAIPSVVAPSISLHTSHPPPHLVMQQRHLALSLCHQLKPLVAPLHRIESSMRIHCPEVRLIQYDCGEWTVLVRSRSFQSGEWTVLVRPRSFRSGEWTVLVRPRSFRSGEWTVLVRPRSFRSGEWTVLVRPRSFRSGEWTVLVRSPGSTGYNTV